MAQGKLKTALKFVEGPLGAMLQSHCTPDGKRVKLMIKLGELQEANVIAKKGLKCEYV